MSNHYADFRNATAFLIFSNVVENHPGATQYIVTAKARGAKIIVVDPRRTRTAALADSHVRIRPGTDIAFINGMIREVIARQDAATVGTLHMRTTLSRTWRNDAFATGTLSWPNLCDATFVLNSSTSPTDYSRETKTLSAGSASNMPVVAGMTASGGGSPSLTGTTGQYTVYEYLKDRVSGYDTATVADICGCTEAELNAAYDMYIDNSYAATSISSLLPYTDVSYKAGTILYAMGTTQHSKGSHMTRVYCMLQVLLGNMGKPGGGINALRGIGNVQGSTDMGLLYGNTVAYNYAQPSASVTYANYQDNLFGDSYPEVYGNVPVRFQQRGFHNQLQAWFHDGTVATDATALYAYYPKGNGVNHRAMFHNTGGITALNSLVGQAAVNEMDGVATPTINMLVVWGQNPRVTEANAKIVEDGLENLDVLVCTDIFLNETAEAPRKSSGVTYFLPAASFAETYGTITNSGRWIQWRNAAIAPKGNTKTDGEILLRLAKALHANGAIISGTNFDPAVVGADNGFTGLWGRYFLNAATAKANVDAGTMTTFTLADSKAIAENLYKEICAPLGGVLDSGTGRTWYGTCWIYSNNTGGGKSGAALTKGALVAGYEPLGTAAAYTAGSVPDGTLEGWCTTDDEGKVATWDGILAKSTNPWDPVAPNNIAVHPYFGIAWLFNRRVMYNNGFTTAAGDTSDLVVAPDQVARLFVHASADHYGNRASGAVNYTWFYRRYNEFTDSDFRTPRHVEPWESPRADLYVRYGPVGTAPTGDHYASTAAERTEFPLTLTTYRHAEHYQGGPMSRNLTLLNELIPEARVELNAYDAGANGIKSGDPVEILSLRACTRTKLNGAVASGTTLTVDSTTGFLTGDRVLVGTGAATHLSANSAAGAVAITVASVTGIIVGDMLTVGPGSGNQEERVVDSIVGSNITFTSALVSAHSQYELVVKEEAAKTCTVVDLTTLTLSSGVKNAHADNTVVYNLSKGWVGSWKAVVGAGLNANQRIARGVVGVPWHWGNRGKATGPTANELCIDALDASTTMPETKVALCKIRKA